MSDRTAVIVARVVVRWAFTLSALFVLGPIAGWLTASLRAVDGSPHTTLLLSTAGGGGAIRGAIVLLMALAIGLGGGRVVGARFGLRTGGFVIGWATWTTGRIDEVIRSTGGAGLGTLVAEGVLVAIGGLLICILLSALASRHEETMETAEFPSGLGGLGAELKGLASISSLVAIVAGAIVGGLVAWMAAIDPLKGQAVFAAFVGAIGIGAGAKLGLFATGREEAPAMIPALVSAAILIVASPASAIVLHGDGALDAAIRGNLFPLAHVLPLDWLCGSMLGIPVGVSWAGSMLKTRAEHEPASA